jgi:short-subunit dehydrogenase
MENTKSAKRKMLDAAAVAQAGLDALKRGKVISIPGLAYKAAPLLARVLTKNLIAGIMRSQQEPT